MQQAHQEALITPVSELHVQRGKDRASEIERSAVGAVVGEAGVAGAWVVKASQIGDFGGGSLEPPRWWLGTQWLGLALGVPGCTGPPRALRRRRGRAGALPRGGTLPVLPGPALSHRLSSII